MYYLNNPYMYHNTYTSPAFYGVDYTSALMCDKNFLTQNPSVFRTTHVPANHFYMVRASFSKEEAAAIALLLGIDFTKSKFDLNQFWMGVNVELEHGRRSNQTNVTNDDPILTGKIALAHLNEFPDYYKRLKVLEDEAKAFWNK